MSLITKNKSTDALNSLYMSNSIKELPPEVMSKIFAFSLEENDPFQAQTRNHILNYSLTSRSCRQISQDSYPALLKLESLSSLNHQEIERWKQFYHSRLNQTLTTTDLIKKCPHLKTLDLSDSLITDGELDAIAGALPSKLEILNLKRCLNLQNPNFQKFPSLKAISLIECRELKNPSFAELSLLKTLDLQGCSKLTDLNLQKLHALQKLNLTLCLALKNLNFEKLTSLETLNCMGCQALTNRNFQDLPALRTLDLEGCLLLTNMSFQDMPFLETLDMSWSIGLTHLQFRNVPALHILDISGCLSLAQREFPELSNRVNIIL